MTEFPDRDLIRSRIAHRLTILRALAELCEESDAGTREISGYIENELRIREGGRIATDVAAAARAMPSHQEWAVGNFPGEPRPFSASLGPWRHRVHARCATLPLALCAVMLKLEAASLEEQDL